MCCYKYIHSSCLLFGMVLCTVVVGLGKTQGGAKNWFGGKPNNMVLGWSRLRLIPCIFDIV